MKNILLLFLGLTLISCSLDDESDSRTTDPIIGTWYESGTPVDSLSFSGTLWTFQANGIAFNVCNGNPFYEIMNSGCMCDIKDWSAVGDNPNFSKKRRVYNFTEDCLNLFDETGNSIWKEYGAGNDTIERVNFEHKVEFSDDFNSFTINYFPTFIRQ